MARVGGALAALPRDQPPPGALPAASRASEPESCCRGSPPPPAPDSLMGAQPESFLSQRKATGRLGPGSRGGTCSRRKSCGLKSLGEQPHQSTMCLYWHLQPSLRFQLVTRRLLSTRLSHAGLFSSTVWKKDCGRGAGGEPWAPCPTASPSHSLPGLAGLGRDPGHPPRRGAACTCRTGAAGPPAGRPCTPRTPRSCASARTSPSHRPPRCPPGSAARPGATCASRTRGRAGPGPVS